MRLETPFPSDTHTAPASGSVAPARANPSPVTLDWVNAAKLRPEADTVAELLSDVRPSEGALAGVEATAADLVEAFRAEPRLSSLLDAFLQEHGLSNDEGVALMCLAEALLRVPDADTRDDLIADKIAPGDWAAHLGSGSTLLVNASTWGLLVTGRVV